MRSRHLGYLCLTAAMLTVGSTVVASKVIGQGAEAFSATALRFAIALPVFVALMTVTRTPWPRPSPRDGALLLAQASAGSVGYTVLLIAGTKMTSASDAGIVSGTLPAMAALFAVVVLGERPSRGLLAAVALATLGVIVVAIGGASRGSTAGGTLAGDLLIVAAVACEAVFILLNRRLRAPLAPLALATSMAGLGLAMSAIPAMLESGGHIPAFSPPALAAIAYYAIVPTVAGFWLWYAGSGRVSGSEASLFTAVAPVSAVIFASLLLREPLTPVRLGGLILVMLAVGAASRANAGVGR